MTRALPELPDGWEWKTVAEVGEVQLGRQRAPRYHNGPNMRPYLRVANVFEDRLDLNDVFQMDFSPDDFARYRLEPGDILLNEGQSPELVGRPAMFRGEMEDVCFTNSLIRFRPHEGIDGEYALLVFRHHLHSGRFQREARITTNIAHLSASRFGSVEFPVPPLAEQREIVHAVETLLESLRLGAEELDGASTEIEELEASLRAAAFADAPAEVQLVDVADVRSGIAKGRPKDGASCTLPYIRTANVQAGYLELSEIKTITVTQEQAERHRLAAGDVLILEGGDADKVGRGWIWGGEIADCLHQNHVFSVRPNREKLDSLFLAHFINAPQARVYFGRCAKQTTNLASINKSQLRALPVPAVPLEEQRERVRTLDAGLAECRALRVELLAARREAERLEAAVLQASVRGRLTEIRHAARAWAYS